MDRGDDDGRGVKILLETNSNQAFPIQVTNKTVYNQINTLTSPKIHFFLSSKSNYSPIMPSMSNIVRFFAAFCVLSTVTSLSVPPAKQAKPMNRLSFLTTSCASAAAVLLAKPSPSFSKEIDPALKGTKADPKYQACLSECVYDCTKPKGDEQKSRAQCLPECKKQCATTKEQLMIGTPLQK